MLKGFPTGAPPDDDRRPSVAARRQSRESVSGRRRSVERRRSSVEWQGSVVIDEETLKEINSRRGSQASHSRKQSLVAGLAAPHHEEVPGAPGQNNATWLCKCGNVI